MSREAFGDPPESQEPPDLCPVCGNAWHAEDCEFGKEVARRLKAERDAHRLAFENEQLRREAERLQKLLTAMHQIAGELARPSGNMRSVTPWFPVAVDPVHEGIYEVEYRQSRFIFRREWRDGVWCIPGAVMLPATRPKRWRGLTAPARTMPKDQK